MKQIWIKTVVILVCALCCFIGNIYLFVQKTELCTQLAQLDDGIEKKTSLIHLAKTKPLPKNGISHRLALPVNRISVGDDFQSIAKTLNIQRLDFQISPEAPLTKTASLDSYSESTVELKFVNQTDQQLFKMITQIMDEFPGLVLPREIVIWRDFTSNTPNIQGHFRFDWLKSLNEKDEL